MSFIGRCAISNLPIMEGDPVLYFFLSEDCGSRQYGWQILSLPLRGEYDGYGSVKSRQVQALSESLCLSRFHQTIVSRGWGKNIYHDMSTSRDMTMDQILVAVGQGRLLVSPWTVTPRDSNKKRVWGIQSKTVPKGVPTLKRIANALRAAGLVVADTAGGSGYFVGKEQRGLYRLRVKEYDRKEQKLAMERAAAVLSEKFSCMVSAGYESEPACLFVSAKAGVDWTYSVPTKKSDYRRVASALVREDVWQTLCGVELKDECLLRHVRADGRVSSRQQKWREDFDVLVGELRGELPSIYNNPKGFSTKEQLREHLYWREQRLGGTNKDITRGVYSEILVMSRWVADGNLSVQEARAWLDIAAEVDHVVDVVKTLGYAWQPLSSYGMDPDWDLHKVMNLKFAEIAAHYQENRESRMNG